MISFDLIFDNGGGITLQTSDYCHNYSNPGQAARDVIGLLACGGDTVGWDSNEPEFRQAYDGEVELNGGYHWVTDNDVFEAVGQMPEEDRTNWLDSISGYAERAFFEALFDAKGGK